MNPFEDLIRDLGKIMDLSLTPDAHQSCVLTFPQKEVSIQIDLDTNADQILIGTELSQLTPGPYREKILTQAMRVNGLSTIRRGILAYSEKNDTLVLFQFLPLVHLNGQKLHDFIQLFLEHAHAWKEAIKRSDIPIIEEDTNTS